MGFKNNRHKHSQSLSARRAWIEINISPLIKFRSVVALRKESVDRNGKNSLYDILRNESLSARRAWIEITSAVRCALVRRSLSARRAWIEMPVLYCLPLSCTVALRKESVDRNCNPQKPGARIHTSLSARRAWIEIFSSDLVLSASAVALRKEGVDRNPSQKSVTASIHCRSPQGGCG